MTLIKSSLIQLTAAKIAYNASALFFGVKTAAASPRIGRPRETEKWKCQRGRPVQLWISAAIHIARVGYAVA
jgi:hypothetical protein